MGSEQVLRRECRHNSHHIRFFRRSQCHHYQWVIRGRIRGVGLEQVYFGAHQNWNCKTGNIICRHMPYSPISVFIIYYLCVHPSIPSPDTYRAYTRYTTLANFLGAHKSLESKLGNIFYHHSLLFLLWPFIFFVFIEVHTCSTTCYIDIISKDFAIFNHA